jgi:hypothetical protein
MKGHAGYREDIADFLYKMGASVVFIYRDLRDVAVSMSYHVIDDDDRNFTHPDKHLYRDLPTQEERIAACIEGIGPYSGLIERWETYAPWLKLPWVHPLKYETMRADPLTASTDLMQYVYKRTGQANGVSIRLDTDTLKEAAPAMVEAMGHKDKSPTFRKGKAGGWREEFTPALKDLFKRHDNGWLVRLGYEESEDW